MRSCASSSNVSKRQCSGTALAEFDRRLAPRHSPCNEEWLTDLGIDGFHDRARFVGPTAVRAGNDDLEAKRVVNASGPVPPNPLPLQVMTLCDHDRDLDLSSNGRSTRCYRTVKGGAPLYIFLHWRETPETTGS